MAVNPKSLANLKSMQKGQSANPKGKPKGTRSAKTLIMDVIGQQGADDLVQAAFDRAIKGDNTVLIALLNKVAPNLQATDLTASVEVTKVPTLADMYDPNFVIDGESTDITE